MATSIAGDAFGLLGTDVSDSIAGKALFGSIVGGVTPLCEEFLKKDKICLKVLVAVRMSPTSYPFQYSIPTLPNSIFIIFAKVIQI